MLTASIAKDGQTAPSANLSMAGFHHLAVGNATLRDNYAAAGQVQDSTLLYAGTSSGADIITATLTPAITAYVTGQRYSFKAGASNLTVAPTLNLNTVGAKSLKKGPAGAAALAIGDIIIGGVYDIEYDGTNFQLLNPASLSPVGAGADLASAATVDLGTIPSHNVRITGTTTITSFGSSADVGTPLYFVKFAGDMLVKHDGTALIIPGLADYSAKDGDCMWLEYAAGGNWRVREIMPRNPAPSVGCANGLTIANNAGTPTTQLDVTTTGRSILESTTGATISIAAQALTINAATTGVNALDTGALANSTWYYVWLISNGSTVAALLSTSATAPTMPAGYVYKYRIGAQRTGGAATFNRILQKGNTAQYTPVAASVTPNYPIMATGGAAWTAVAWAAFAPTTAMRIRGAVFNSGSGLSALVGPNNVPSTSYSSTTPPYGTNRIGATNSDQYVYFDMLMESANIYYGGGVIFTHGWTDGGVNAN